MSFNIFSFVRISSQVLTRKKPIRTAINNLVELIYSYSTIPKKLKLLQKKINEYNRKIDQINDDYRKKLKLDRQGNYLDTLR